MKNSSDRRARFQNRAFPLTVLAIAIFCAAFSATSARADVTLQILATDPQPPAELGKYQHLSLRISYTSDRPIHVRAQPFYRGEKVSAMTSGSPSYEVGTGEAFFWLTTNGAALVDEIEVTAEANNEVIARTVLPVDLRWSAELNQNPPAPAEWVGRMKAEQEHRIATHQAAQMHGPGALLATGFGLLFFACVPGYFILQFFLLWRLDAGWRKAAAIPLWPMVPVLLYTVYAYLDGSNLFPVLLILVSPIAVCYLVVLTIAWRMKASAP